MNRQFDSVWRSVGAVDPRKLVEARLQLHWAAQPVMAFADCALEKMPDDSQANLGWRDDIEAMVGRQRPDGLSAGLRMPDMSILVFDLGTLISSESSGDVSSGRSIGVGMSPGDSWYPEPYFYVNPYGLADLPADGPALESDGHWHTEGWFGAVLTATSIVEQPGGSQEATVLSFLHGAVDAARNLLSS